MDKQDKLVSIIMGVYNEEASLEACLQSILAQSYTNWEFVICDDASTDGTPDILKRYSRLDCRIHVIRNERNARLAASLNRCLEIASGEYVARMDADDVALPQRLAHQVAFLNDHPEIAVVGGTAQISDGSKTTGIRKCKAFPTSNDVLTGPTFIHPSIMMRKEVYSELGGYTVVKRTARGQDWDLWFRFFAAGYKGANLEEAVIIYHEDENAYKKRTMKTAWGYCRTALCGFHMLNVPVWKYYLAFKPMVSALISENIKKKLRGELLK